MILTGDYHTHTKYSHGKGTVLENALTAKNKGLKEIAISDHGFSHPVFGLSKRKLKDLKKDCERATAETGVRVLTGIESNFISFSGKVDLPVDLYDCFDVFLAGLHKFVLFDFKTLFSTSISNLILSKLKVKKAPKGLVERNTKMHINVIKNNPVDIITHLNYCSFVDVGEVAKAASDYGTYIELNAKKTHMTDNEINAVLKTNARFVISSDAHSPNRVGEISLVEKMLQKLEFPLDRIDNINGRTPNFRFRNFKEKSL